MLSLSIYKWQHENLLAVGASTSICSVIGFDMACRVLQKNVIPVRMRRIWMTVLWIFIISLIPGIDFWGHFGSLFGGVCITLAFFNTQSCIQSQMKRNLIKYIGLFFFAAYSAALIVGVTADTTKQVVYG